MTTSGVGARTQPMVSAPGWVCRLAACLLATIALAACSGPRDQAGLRLGANTLNVAGTALAGGNPRLALNIANAVLKTHPGDAQARLTRGDALYMLGDCGAAIRDYRAVLRRAAGNADAEIGLGRCALREHPGNARAYFERAVRDAPKDAVAYNDLGVAQAELSAFGQASASFRQALALDSSMRAAKVNLGMTLALGGHPHEAQQILAPLAHEPGATARIRADYATALARDGDVAGAASVLRTDMTDAAATRMAMQLAALPGAASGPAPATGAAD